MPEINIRLDLQYKGTDFSGWQYQPGEITVQGEIEKAIEKVSGKKVNLIGAGRTDAGVHALGQVANFKIDHCLPPEKYKDAINFYLPQTILATNSARVADDFHARKSAKWRHYRYIIDRKKTALYFDYRWECNYNLEVGPMVEIAEFILGTHDFKAFCAVASQKENNQCEIYESGWSEEETLLVYNIRANRFLHSMVRSLIGAMVEAGRGEGRLTLNEFKDIMASGDHTRLKYVAPARGLYLVEVGY
jgi:tRNA pseudouridine38-40 synthase